MKASGPRVFLARKLYNSWTSVFEDFRMWQMTKLGTILHLCIHLPSLKRKHWFPRLLDPDWPGGFLGNRGQFICYAHFPRTCHASVHHPRPLPPPGLSHAQSTTAHLERRGVERYSDHHWLRAIVGFGHLRSSSDRATDKWCAHSFLIPVSSRKMWSISSNSF